MKHDEKKPSENRSGEDAAVPVEIDGAEPAQDDGNDAEHWKVKCAYLAAEFENYRKRVAREREITSAYENEKILTRAILPVLDNLERAMGPGKSGGAETILQGVRMTYDLALLELAKFGLVPIEAKGVAFDPSLHEAIAQILAPASAEGTVLDEARKGYMLNGRLLRPAQVAVALGPRENGDDAGNG